MDIKKYQRKRFSAVGCDNGELVVSVCDTDTDSKCHLDLRSLYFIFFKHFLVLIVEHQAFFFTNIKQSEINFNKYKYYISIATHAHSKVFSKC